MSCNAGAEDNLEDGAILQVTIHKCDLRIELT